MPNAFLIFLIAFSGITGWLMLREPADISLANAPATSTKKAKAKQPETTPATTPDQVAAKTEDPFQKHLRSTTLAFIDFTDATLEEAIAFLQLQTTEHTGVSKSLSFRFSNEESKILDTTITVFAENISMADALDLICEKAQCHWEIADNEILILTS